MPTSELPSSRQSQALRLRVGISEIHQDDYVDVDVDVDDYEADDEKENAD